MTGTELLFTTEEVPEVLAAVGTDLSAWRLRRLTKYGAVQPAREAGGHGASALYDLAGVALARAVALLEDVPADVRERNRLPRGERVAYLACICTLREGQQPLRDAVRFGQAVALAFEELDEPGRVLPVEQAMGRQWALVLPWSHVMRGLRAAASEYRSVNETLWVTHQRVDSSTAATLVERVDWRS